MAFSPRGLLLLSLFVSSNYVAGLNLDNVHNEILSYKDVADKIIQRSVYGQSQNQSWNRLATFVDKFGSRLVGTQNLENSIDYMLNVLKADGLENVHGEEVTVPHWVRGEESATLMKPRVYKMGILGLGSSIGTPPEGITAEVLVVRSFDELHKNANKAKGKIIVYNEEFVEYGITVAYRVNGAVEAAKVGGVASLIRSVASFSIYSPHTGIQSYNDTVKKIPTACITVEDAEMLDRMSQRGEKIVINLKMGAKNLPPVKSRNTVAEIIGSKYPEQIVLVSGHLDSWDVGQGAMDDGGGAFISWQALSLIRQLGLRPKRTMRMVMWTAEEPGHVGAEQYWQRHKSNVSNYDLVLESDGGTFTPTGLAITGNKAALSIMESVLKLLKPINASVLTTPGDSGDVADFINAGVPGGSLNNMNEKYFYFHHSNADMMTIQDRHAMDLCSALWAVVSYVVADMDQMLPRDKVNHV